MTDAVKINRLLEYTLTFKNPYNPDILDEAVTFTADSYAHEPTSNSLKFYRAGNLIREEFNLPARIVATPADAG